MINTETSQVESSEKTMQCSCCSEEWEESFFCTKCSGLETFSAEFTLEPNPFWCGSPSDEYVMRERDPEYMDVCFNSCQCRTFPIS